MGGVRTKPCVFGLILHMCGEINVLRCLKLKCWINLGVLLRRIHSSHGGEGGRSGEWERRDVAGGNYTHRPRSRGNN